MNIPKSEMKSPTHVAADGLTPSNGFNAVAGRVTEEEGERA
jgi:hypothetical protein